MKSFASIMIFCFLLFAYVPSMKSYAGEEALTEILDHQWRIDEDWEKIGKTKYSWWAVVKNHSPHRQRVWIYFSLLDQSGFPLARNATDRRMSPNQTLKIKSDSYLDTTLVERIYSSQATLKSRVLGQ